MAYRKSHKQNYGTQRHVGGKQPYSRRLEKIAVANMLSRGITAIAVPKLMVEIAGMDVTVGS